MGYYYALALLIAGYLIIVFGLIIIIAEKRRVSNQRRTLRGFLKLFRKRITKDEEKMLKTIREEIHDNIEDAEKSIEGELSQFVEDEASAVNQQLKNFRTDLSTHFQRLSETTQKLISTEKDSAKQQIEDWKKSRIMELDRRSNELLRILFMKKLRIQFEEKPELHQQLVKQIIQEWVPDA